MFVLYIVCSTGAGLERCSGGSLSLIPLHIILYTNIRVCPPFFYVTDKLRPQFSLGFFDRYLSTWVGLWVVLLRPFNNFKMLTEYTSESFKWEFERKNTREEWIPIISKSSNLRKEATLIRNHVKCWERETRWRAYGVRLCREKNLI